MPDVQPGATAEPSDAQLYRVVGDVIERIRSEDQVAMSLLIETKKNAARGNPRARRTIRAAMAYLDRNPPVRFGGVTAQVAPAVIRLWTLDQVPAEKACEALAQDLTEVSFWQAVVALSFLPQSVIDGAKLPAKCNKVVGLASKLRALDDPSVPVSAFCPVCGWELGEGDERGEDQPS